MFNATEPVHGLYFERLADALKLPHTTRDAAVAALAGQFAGTSNTIPRAPLVWFNFYDFWHSPEAKLP